MIPGCTSNSEYAGALNIQIWSPTFRDEQQRNIHKQLHGCSFRLEQGWSTLRLEQGWSGVLHSVGGTERSRRERGDVCVVDLGGREDGVSPEAHGHRRQELGGGEGLASTESVADLNLKVEA